MLESLNRFGCAQTTLQALTGDATLLGALQQEAARLEAAQSVAIEERRRYLADLTDLGDGNDKHFLIQLLDSRRPVVSPDGVLARVALGGALKTVVDSYYGMRTQVSDLNIWRTLPTRQPAVSSQLWHRDQPDDHFVVKLFVYLEDVGPGSGPFCYLTSTHGKGNRAWRPPATKHDGHNFRADESEIELAGGGYERREFTGPAGTVLLADTIGWHKGGQATEQPRLLFHALYSSRAARPIRRLGRPDGYRSSRGFHDLAYAAGS